MRNLSGNLISITDACRLLQISRPTFNARRTQFQLKEIQIGKTKKFLKSELIEKIYAETPPLARDINLTMLEEEDRLSALLIDESSLDLRRLNTIDGFGILTLLARVRNLAVEKGHVYLLLPDDAITSVLEKSGFFREIRRYYKTQVEWNEDLLVRRTSSTDPNDLSIIRYVGFKGQERNFSEELQNILAQHGFSSDTSAYILWVLGELADNAHTHSKGPCYFYVERFEPEATYLQFSLVDVGVGIEKSLKGKAKHGNLSDPVALLTAFKSKVSSWPDEAERGKGLSDILKIAVGNQGLLRVESNHVAFLMSFANFKEEIRQIFPLTNSQGARLSVVLIDSKFDLPERHTADEVIDRAIQGLI